MAKKQQEITEAANKYYMGLLVENLNRLKKEGKKNEREKVFHHSIDWQKICETLRDECNKAANSLESNVYYYTLLLKRLKEWDMLHDNQPYEFDDYELHLLYIEYNHHQLEYEILTERGRRNLAGWHYNEMLRSLKDYQYACKFMNKKVLPYNPNILFKWQYNTYIND